MNPHSGKYDPFIYYYKHHLFSRAECSMTYLGKRLNDYQDLINNIAPPLGPVPLLLNNINFYYGKRRHHGLFKVSGPRMWDFTVGGLLVPKIDDIEHLFESKETAEENQDLEEVKQIRIPQISSEKQT